MSKKVMVSATISWYDVTRPFFVNNNGIRVNKENHCRHLFKELFPAIEKVFISLIPLGTGLSFKKMGRGFIRAKEGPSLSPDVNQLDYFYWDFVKSKLYDERSGKPFASEPELKKKIKSLRNTYTNDLLPTRKSFK